MRPPQYASGANTVNFCSDVATKEDVLSNELTDRTAARECELRCRSVNTCSFACQKKSYRREKKQECATISQRFWRRGVGRRQAERLQTARRRECRRAARRPSAQLRWAMTNRERPRCRDRAQQYFVPMDRLRLKFRCWRRAPEASLARWRATVPAAGADEDLSKFKTSRHSSD